MSTTEVVVEQLVIGALLMAVLVVLVPTDVTTLVYNAGVERLSLLLVVAYVLGVVYDRLADTLLQDLERRQRSFAALKWYGKPPAPSEDPFPEDRYRALSLTSEGASAYASYLRSRIRLARAATTLAPAVIVAAGAVHWHSLGDGLVVDTVLLVPLAIYPAAFLTKLVPPLRPKADASHPLVDRLRRIVRGTAVPRTDELADFDRKEAYARAIDWAKESESSTPRVLARERLTIALLALSVWEGTLAWLLSGWQGLGWAAAIPPVTLLFGWAWWRISWTYTAFLRTWTLHGAAERS